MAQQTGGDSLRNWLQAVDEAGELETVQEAHWDQEMGAIAEMVEQNLGHESPALLFDNIPGYEKGFRTLYNQLGSVKRLALAAGLPTKYNHLLDFVDAFDDATNDVTPVETNLLTDGPIFENSRQGVSVNLTEVPVPYHHEQDGGRYIGTACCVITADPDTEWINVGTYRGMVKDDNELFLYISPGKHGRLMRDKYFDRGEPMPVTITFGQDPGLWFASCTETEKGVSELEYAGGLREAPIEVVEGNETGLPIPANAEIAVEGYMRESQTGTEGPFGEWTGYYGSGEQAVPYMTVDRMYFRDNPILTCSAPHKPPQEVAFFRAIIRSALLKQELEGASVPNVEGVWTHEAGCTRQFNVVSINQGYAGHARQAAYVATQTRAGAYAGRWTIVVDDDIDPTDTEEVLWAMCTRCDPKRDVEFIDKAWSTPLDPMVPEGEKDAPFNSRAIVDATIPFARLETFPEVAQTSEEYRKKLRSKWGDSLPI